VAPKTKEVETGTNQIIAADLSKGVAIRDPQEGEAFRSNPDPRTQIPAYVIPDEGQYHVIARTFLPTFEKEFPGRAKAAVLHMCMNVEGEVFFWPIEIRSDTAA
jgi:hypothetical protein